MLYSRSDEGGPAFEPQRNLMQRTSALDGGGTVAADNEGNVYVAWHGRTEERRTGRDRASDVAGPLEGRRGDIRSRSTRLGPADRRLCLLRHMRLGRPPRDGPSPVSSGHRRRRTGHLPADFRRPRWSLPGHVGPTLAANVCPMSSASLAESGSGVLAAWETQGQVYFRRIEPKSHEASPAIAPPGGRGDRNTRPWPATPAERPSWSGPRAPAGRKVDHWPGRSSTDPATHRARGPDRGWCSNLGPGHGRRPARRRVHDHHLPAPLCAVRAGNSMHADSEKVAELASDLLHLDTEAARDAVANYAASSPLRLSTGPTHPLILDGATRPDIRGRGGGTGWGKPLYRPGCRRRW